jgi:hypothetical protein
MTVNGSEIKDMEKAHSLGLVARSTKEIINLIEGIQKMEFLLTRTVLSTLVAGETICAMVMVFSSSLTKACMKASSKTTK